MAENKDIQIKTGYQVFALADENGLKIEALAKKVGISKSSLAHFKQALNARNIVQS